MVGRETEKNRWGAFALFLTTLLVIESFATPAAQGQDRFFGLNGLGSGFPGLDAGTVGNQQLDVGADVHRTDFLWAQIEATQGVFDFSQTDPIVSALADRGIHATGYLFGPPTWASSCPAEPDFIWCKPANMSEWQNFVQKVVQRYKSSIKHWEIWNEPNNPDNWKAPATAADYVSLLQSAASVIRSEDPQAKIVLGGLSGIDLNFLKSVFDLGGWSHFDIVAVHPWELVEPDYFGRLNNLARLRSLVNTYGAKPIWYSEMGWPSAGNWGAVSLSEAKQSDFLLRDHGLAFLNSIRKFLWWNFWDTGSDPSNAFHHMGLLRENKSSQKPAYTAYQVMTDELGPSSFWRRRDPFADTRNLLTSFEASETWTVSLWAGATGSFQYVGSPLVDGALSAKLNYDFSGVPDGSFGQASVSLVHEFLVPGTPTKFGVWVLPDDGDHVLKAQFGDADGDIFQVPFGNTIGNKWTYTEADLNDPARENLGDAGDNNIDYPVRFLQFTLQQFGIPEFPFYGKRKGAGSIYLDRLMAVHGAAPIYDIQFRRGPGFVDLVWTTASSPKSVPFPTTKLTTRGTDGATSTVVDGGAGDLDGANGKVTLSVGQSPLFVEWLGPREVYEVRGRGDFDGDQASDVAVWRPSTGEWFFLFSGDGAAVQPWGLPGDVPVPADYDDDMTTDIAVWRPLDGRWWVIRSSGGVTSAVWGQEYDIPVPADYDGDGIADFAVWRPSTGVWWILGSSSGVQAIPWGVATDIPVPADYDGDGIADVALWRPSTGEWWVIGSSAGVLRDVWGVNGDAPVPGDYDGDNTVDRAVWRPSTGEWWALRSTGGAQVQVWGVDSDVPVPGDYDGDGLTDAAIWRLPSGQWWLARTTAGVSAPIWGLPGDVAVE